MRFVIMKIAFVMSGKIEVYVICIATTLRSLGIFMSSGRFLMMREDIDSMD